MKRRFSFVVAGLAAATVASRLLRARHGNQGYFAPIVWINRDAEDVREAPGLLGLSDQHEVEIKAEGAGTVVRSKSGKGPSWRKLRETRQLLETGEVLSVEGQPHGARKPVGALLERAGQAVKERRR
ncbi:hypothetical protein [Flindersiella endophytica]